MGTCARMHLPRRQRGLAMLVLLALFAMGAAYLLVTALNKGSVQLSLTRAEKDRAVMQQAKSALIAWAASEASQPTSGQGFQPGALPCPDVDNNGTSDYTGQNCTAYLGRLPYSTLGIEDLRDSSGERLWYAVSTNFNRSTNNVINSDKNGSLTIITITGQALASNVIAVVLAPGARLGNQDRSAAGINIPANYLEPPSITSATTSFVTATENLTDAVVANLFNDNVLAITQQDLFSVVDPVVAARIQRDIVAQFIYNSDPSLTDSGKVWSDNTSDRKKSRYFDAWGGFPFAAPFVSPPSSTNSPNYTGQDATPGPALYEGLLPVVSNLTYTWSSGGVIQTGGSGTLWGGSTCSPTFSNTRLSCNIWYISGAPTMAISGTVPNVGRSFVQLTQLGDVSCSGCSLTARRLTGSLDSAGNGIVTLAATLNSVGGSWTNVTVTIRNTNLLVSALTSTLSTDFAGWFNNNQWYRLTYYAVSTGYAPGGAGSCTVGGTCLTVNNLATTPNNKQAIIILAGRALNGVARPNGTLSNYLEGQNASTGDRTYETALRNVTSAGAAINDKAVVIAP